MMRFWLVFDFFHVLLSCSGRFTAVLLSVHHVERHLPPSQQSFYLGMYLSKSFTWVNANGYCGIEFEERGNHIWVFTRCWDKNQFHRDCVTILSRFSSNANQEVGTLGPIIDAMGPNFRVVSVRGGPHALAEAYVSHLTNGIIKS